MAAAAAADIEPEAEGLRFVESRVAYANDEWRTRAAAAGGGANVTDDDKPKIGSKQSRHANTSLVDVQIWDARPVADRLQLEANGFCLLQHTPAVDAARWMDRQHVREAYYPPMAELVKRATGCQWVAVPPGKFGHVCRNGDKSDFDTSYSRYVHADYNEDMEMVTAASAARQMATCCVGATPPTEEAARRMRYIWVNTWQPWGGAVRQDPLVILDPRTIAPSDCIEYLYGGGVGTGPMTICPNPDHNWYYFENMSPDEVLITKQMDQELAGICKPGDPWVWPTPEGDRTRMCPHTSARVPGVGEAPPRCSVEVRWLCGYEPTQERGKL